MMHRRSFLAGAAAFAAAGPGPLAADTSSLGKLGVRQLILIEVNGGWDGLNVVVPRDDPHYRRLRPRLAVPRDQTLALDEKLGLARELEPLMAPWHAGEMAIALGVGYRPPNRSHFRSIEIWNSASDADETLSEGWLSRLFHEAGVAGPALESLALASDGLVLGGPTGPLAGPGLRSVVLRDPGRLGQQAEAIADPMARNNANPALGHILDLRGQLHETAKIIQSRLAQTSAPLADFPRSPIGRQLALAARLITSQVPVAVLKLQQSGYDTHAGQKDKLSRLLRDLATGLGAFRRTLRAAGAWDRTLVMTYGEFGRRAGENASGGTDHGTAAAHFLLGGKVKGGLLGAQPPLHSLDNGDLHPSTDFRRLYATAAQAWWGLRPTPGALANERPLDCIA